MTATFGPYKATVANIHDGTRHKLADVDLGFNVHQVSGVGIVLERQSVRLLGCNAPELATSAGKAALAYLESIVHVGDEVTLVSHGWDKYGGRIDGAVTLADGRDLTAVMIAAGHAIAWDGQGPKPLPGPAA